jgi:hypothetical protein
MRPLAFPLSMGRTRDTEDVSTSTGRAGASPRTHCIHSEYQTHPLRLRVVFAGLELEVTDK